MDSRCRQWSDARDLLKRMVMANHGATLGEDIDNVPALGVYLEDVVLIVAPDPDGDGEVHGDTVLGILPITIAMRNGLSSLP
jgi:hypothetical protein